MKRTMLIGIVLLTMLIPAETSLAADYKLGLKLWTNTWEESVHPQAGDSQTFDNGYAFMTGPSLDVRFSDKWFVDVTYLATVGKYESHDWIIAGDSMKFRRQDLDVAVGRIFRPSYLFRPNPGINLGVFGAYKMIDAPASYTNAAAGLSDFGLGTWKLAGPGLGFLAEVPFNQSTMIYSKLTFFALRQKFAFSTGGGVKPFSTHGTAFELGVEKAYTPALSASLSFKFQLFAGTVENGDDITDTFYGPFGGITYAF